MYFAKLRMLLSLDFSKNNLLKFLTWYLDIYSNHAQVMGHFSGLGMHTQWEDLEVF